MLEIVTDGPTVDSETRSRAERGLELLLHRQDIGFFHAPERLRMWREVEKYGKDVLQKARRLVVLGIGGSSLGGKAIVEAFRHKINDRPVHFIDNVDAADFWRLVNGLGDVSDVHWLIISKSGNTIETLTAFNFVSQQLDAQSVTAKPFTVVTTLNRNPLHAWAADNGVTCFSLDEDIGGRYSVLTPVGLLVAAFLGLEIEKIRMGAKQALRERQKLVHLAAQSLKSFERSEWITLFWVYSNLFYTFGLWLQQLWAESLGKSQNREGQVAPRVSSPFVCLGASDQHSILQQVMEGAKDKFVWFFRVGDSESGGPKLEHSIFSQQDLMLGKTLGQLLGAEAAATQRALQAQGVSTLTLKIEELTPESLGFNFMFFELLVATIGEALNINSFDQPGVEAGKIEAKKILSIE